MTRISYSLIYVSHIILHVNINQITGLLVTFLLYNDKNIIQLIICKPHYATCKYKSNNRFIGVIPIIV